MCVLGKNMRLIIFLFALVFGMKANGLPELISFYEISYAGKHLHEKRIEVVGFLSVIKFDNTSLIYLCSNQDACFSVSKDRLNIEFSEQYSGDINDYDQCHVSINGIYKFEPSTNISRSFGKLKDVISISLAISRHDYSKFNGSCKVWNDFAPKINKTEESSTNFDKRMSKR